MCCKNFWKRILSFAIALAIGLLVVKISQQNIANESPKEIEPKNETVKSEKGTGISERQKRREFADKYYEDLSRENNGKNVKFENQNTKNLQIISKPRPKYTELAEQNNVQGSVTLRVTFLANGQIGTITDVSTLPYGLTEEAIAAAKQIKFEPAKRNGETVSVTKLVQYNFTIY